MVHLNISYLSVQFAAEALAYRAVINQSRTGIERIASCGRKYNQQF